jgi:hypothetical protein
LPIADCLGALASEVAGVCCSVWSEPRNAAPQSESCRLGRSSSLR